MHHVVGDSFDFGDEALANDQGNVNKDLVNPQAQDVLDPCVAASNEINPRKLSSLPLQAVLVKGSHAGQGQHPLLRDIISKTQTPFSSGEPGVGETEAAPDRMSEEQLVVCSL